MNTSIYKTPLGEARILSIYDDFQKSLEIDFEDRMVDTRFGQTHVLVTGPANGLPVVVTHGGNSITPQALRGLLPFLRLGKYRVYAPDTIGHPGKSAQVRLSPADLSYGQWLNDVLDGLDLKKAAFIGGSYGAGIILKLAALAPQRVSCAALYVPSGIVPVPITSMMFKIGLPFLLYLLFPSRKRMLRAIQWMGDGIEEDVIELIEAVFMHVRVEAEMPLSLTKAELEHFTSPALVIAAENDAMFPGQAVVKRAKEIFFNLSSVECLQGDTHFSSVSSTEYVNRRIIEFFYGLI